MKLLTDGVKRITTEGEILAPVERFAHIPGRLFSEDEWRFASARKIN